MTSRWLETACWQPIVLRLLILLGLTVSSALVADYVFEIGTFCGVDDPCGEVAASEFGHVFGVPLAAIGLMGFGLIMIVSLIPSRLAGAIVRALAVGAGLAGVTLLLIQAAVLHRYCPLCLIADFGAIALAAVALLRRPSADRPSWLWVRVFVWTWAGLAAALVPLFWEAAHLPAAAPEAVRAYWVPGKKTMIEVTDFDCPHCQRADPMVREWLKRNDVRFVRIVAPIPGHLEAWPAAAAYVAAVRQGKGEQMAEALYAASSRDVASCRKVATQVGLDLKAYERAVADPAVETEIRANLKWVEPAKIGQPFFWIQDELIVGVPTMEKLDRALEQAKPAR
jgi:Vitamin K epoxide reductase family/Thioredoxin